MEILSKKKISFQYYDPYIKKLYRNRNFYTKLNSIKVTAKKLKSFDATIIVTDHDNINWDMVLNNSKLILDTRNVYKQKFDNVINA